LESNLRTRHKGVGTYIDAKSLADGQISALSRVQLLDSKVIADVESALKHAQARARPWQLVVQLDGKHEFQVQPAVSNTSSGPFFLEVLRS